METQTMTKTNSKNTTAPEAIILDMDGVITQTAKVHLEAWKTMFNQFLKRQEKGYQLMTDEDYLQHLDGKPRLKGVQSFLDSRDIQLPKGYPEDSLAEQTQIGLGNKKNELFLELIDKQGVDVYEPAIGKIKEWRDRGLKIAVISSSNNCIEVLEAAGVDGLFDVRVDGVVSSEKKLDGKPEPDIFLEAARQLNVSPRNCVVFEDARSGVQAASKGNFGLVIGVDRSNNERELYINGADIVTQNIGEIDLFDDVELTAYFNQSLPPTLIGNQEFQNKLKAKTPVLFLDFDGTLSPLVKRPAGAQISGDMKRILNQCASAFKVAIVSGRDMDDVKQRVGIDTIIYAGSHGFRISGPDGLYHEHEKSEEILPVLNKIEKELSETFKDISGVQIDRKRYAIAVHYRNAAAEDIAEIKQRTMEMIEGVSQIKHGEGKKLIEIKPNVDWHKGKAIEWILQELGLENNSRFVPLYLGDDVTDEDAFRTLSSKGIGILVGMHGQPTAAKYSLKNVYQVQLFLAQLVNNQS